MIEVVESIDPSLSNGYATDPDESAYPGLWDGLFIATSPALGQQGSAAKDISKNHEPSDVATMIPYRTTPFGVGLENNVDGDEIDYSGDPINFATGSDFSDLWVGFADAFLGVNPGGWRSGAVSTGNTFNIIQGSTGRPFVRMNSVDILKPGSGVGIQTGRVFKALTVNRSSVSTKWFLNGVLRHSATHSVATIPFSVYRLGWQFSTGERIDGVVHLHLMWKRALTDAEAVILTLDPLAPFRLKEPAPFFVPAVAGFNPYWATPASHIVGGVIA